KKKHEWKFVSFVRHSCSLHYSRFRVSILIILSILKRILVFLVTRILILVVLVIGQRIVTWSGAPIIIPSMVAPSTTVSFFRNISKSAIKPIPNKDEWKSVSFIRQSRSFHYGRFVLILFLFFRGD
ncbi:hypothetical protein, partial [Clostridium botulinum]|uniref:hypothetical protein n=1 Tax=Clostridium botulinum TaxID=1491 RepID=UPI003EF572C0